MINGDTLERNYKDTLSDYKNWDQKSHAATWVLLPVNLGPKLGIDETSFNGELYTILHNKAGHGRKGSIVAIVKGVKPDVVAKVINKIPEDERLKVTSITMDLSDSMRSIARMSFPNARVTRDCFHVVKRGGEGSEELRLRFKREAVKETKKQQAEFRKHLKKMNQYRKAYADRMRKKHGKNWHKSNRGRKPKRLNTRFEPKRLENGETKVEALTRCRTQLLKSRDKWSESQEKRGKILFKEFPKLEDAYNLVNSLRAIFRNKKLTKATAKDKLHEWNDKVTDETLREIKSVRDTIKLYEDEILNYFIDWETNASAESLNAKAKCFRAELKGVNEISFFMYRLTQVLG